VQPKNIGRWPAVLQAVATGGEDSELAMSALGAAVWQLRRCLIDHDLLTMQRFAPYIPPDLPASADDDDVTEPEEGKVEPAAGGAAVQHLVLDGTTLSNLEVFRNNYDQSSKGSLWAFMKR
jgi:DNA mismatch repair protein MSH6